MDLIVFESVLDCVGVIVVLAVFFQHLVFVDDGVLFGEKDIIFLIKQRFHGHRVK